MAKSKIPTTNQQSNVHYWRCDGGDTQIFLEQASRSFLTKPFTPDELKATVRETLEGIGN